MSSGINIKYKKAYYSYQLFDTYVAGIMLKGTEIKSLRTGKASFVDPFCVFKKGELWLRGMHISEYEYGTIHNHEPKRERKLLLNQNELSKLERKYTEKGFTIIPTRCFVNENGLAKVEIALARGKKLFDKRESLKKQDIKRDIDRDARIG